MQKSFLILILIILSILPGNSLLAQREDDTITMNNGVILVGKILWMEEDRLEVDVDYGYDDWVIKWSRVVSINSENEFQVFLSDGEFFYGSLTGLHDSKVMIITMEMDSVTCSLQDIVTLRPIDDRFVDNLEASISVGFDMAQARNLKSFTTRSKMGYKTKVSFLDLSYDALFSSQDNTEDIRRSEGIFNYYYIFPRLFYANVSTSGLSNTEQKLELRWSLHAGLGHFLISNQTLYWGILLGANHNIERYLNDTEGRDSWEGLLQTTFDTFNLGDLKIKISALAYPGITDAGRWRTDFKFDIKYDIKYLNMAGLTNKIFIALGVSANFDNRPAENASKTDYIITTTLGLSWNE